MFLISVVWVNESEPDLKVVNDGVRVVFEAGLAFVVDLDFFHMGSDETGALAVQVCQEVLEGFWFAVDGEDFHAAVRQVAHEPLDVVLMRRPSDVRPVAHALHGA